MNLVLLIYTLRSVEVEFVDLLSHVDIHMNDLLKYYAFLKGHQYRKGLSACFIVRYANRFKLDIETVLLPTINIPRA